MSEIDDIRAMLGAKPRPVGWAERRARLDEVGNVWPVAGDIALEATTLGGVPCEWSLAPGAEPSRVLMFFHGGGFCSGSIASHRRLATEAGRAAGMRTLAVGYRLAPEHPYPAALDDASAVWQELRRQGHEARQIALAGDSAGGALSVALALALRDRGEALPFALWLLSPWTDLAMTGATMASKETADPLIHKAYLEELAAAYVPAAIGRARSRASRCSMPRLPACRRR